MIKQSLRVVSMLLLVSLLVGAIPASAGYRGPIYSSTDLDYQPAIIRMQPSSTLMIVFERLDSGFSGDFYVTFSNDNGETWAVPQTAIASSANERHPSLVQLGPNSYALFYLKDVGSSQYRLFRATSTDGVTWVEQGQLDLGWASPGEINPNVIRAADGTLTMTYHRLSGPVYIAQSSDNGVTWDTLQTQISSGNAQLPRLTQRQSDGLYVVTYQVGSSDLDIFSKATYDPYDWSGPQGNVSTAYNSHDSQPIVLEDGTFLVTYAVTDPGPYFDMYYRTSLDGLNWSPAERATTDPSHYDTQPHPLLQGTLGRVMVAWSHQVSADPYVDHDVYIDSDLIIPADLTSSQQTMAPAVVEPGNPITTTIVLHNDGPGPTSATLTDTIPLSTTYQIGSLWASHGQYSYDPVGEVITWTGTISYNSAPVTITFGLNTDLGLADGTQIDNVAQLVDQNTGEAYELDASVLVDSAPPVSTILEPAASALISTTTFMISGTANDTVSGVAEVSVSIDGGGWQSATGLESWNFLWTGYSEGNHNIRTRAVDTLGHIETPAAGITVTVDTVAPVLLSNLPISGALDIPLTTTLTLTFSEPILTSTLAYEVTPDPGSWEATWNDTGTVATLAPANLQPGQTYTITVIQARDLAGNPLTPTTWWFTTISTPVFIPLILRP